ncbi:MAG: sigma-70 family RNA polymerase sigma factor [Planctomycetes bacterium]|nr:sigma-70 family RNA polymerase sigma factor [Planctomycetota bacterium]
MINATVTNATTEPESVAERTRDAWASLYDQYSTRVWRYVARLIGSDSSAVADAVQETFLAAARNFEQFDESRGTHWAWLTGIAHRQAALHWRRTHRERSRDANTVKEATSREATTAPLEQAETVAVVRRVLAELPSDSAALLTGKYCEGFSVAELVEQLGGTTEGVRSKLARARRDFRARYEKAGGEAQADSLRNI